MASLTYRLYFHSMDSILTPELFYNIALYLILGGLVKVSNVCWRIFNQPVENKTVYVCCSAMTIATSDKTWKLSSPGARFTKFY